MPRVTQPSFAKGEIAPEMHGRIDTAAYATGLATARNAIVHIYGGVGRRPGSRFIGPVKDHTYAPRLIPFQFKTTDTYILEFGEQYMRIIRDAGYVTETPVVMTGATQASPVVVTSTAHGNANGDEVYLSGVVGMTELNGRRFIVANQTANTYELLDQVTGLDVDGTGYTTYVSGGSGAKIYEIATPYAQADLFELAYTQSADVMTITNRNYPIYQLGRTGHTSWTMQELAIGPQVTEPVGVVVTVNTAGTEEDWYKVTSVDKQTGEESLSALDGVAATISGATQTNPVVITATGHGLVDGDEIKIDAIVGMTELNGYRFLVTNGTANTFELYDVDGLSIDGTGYSAYVSDGIARNVFTYVSTSAVEIDNTISWSAVQGAEYYLVYRKTHGIYGFIGETKELEFLDENFAPNTSITIPNLRIPFDEEATYPQAVGYYEQRRVFGGSLIAPDTSVYTQTGNQSNFNVSRPIQADDAITATLASLEVNSIRHYIPLNNLLILTSGSEWMVRSGPDSAFGPTSIRQAPQSLWGSSYVTPIVAGSTTLFVTADQASLRSFGYSFQIDGYTGSNLNTLSQHMLRGRKITDMCYTRNPEGRVWMVRDDGEMLAMTFDQDQQIVAWSTLDTDGKYEACASLPLGGAVDHFGHAHQHTEDAVYTVVKRKINGQTVRYIETMIQNSFFDVRECFFVDSGLSFDNPIDIEAVSVGDTKTLVRAPAHGFEEGDEIDILGIEWAPTYDGVFNATQPAQLNGGRYTVHNIGDENLFTYSEQFDHSDWSKTRLSISADATTAPDLELTADKLVEDTGSGVHHTSRSFTPEGDTTYTLSVYVKASERTYICLEVGGFSQQVDPKAVYADLSTGTIVTSDPDRASIEDIGNGWYRVSSTITTVPVPTGNLSPKVYLSTGTSGASRTYTGDGTSGLYIWGSQFEVSEDVGSYSKTTSVADTVPDTFHLKDKDGNDIDSTLFNAYVANGQVRKTVSTVGGLWHLEGEEVVALADGDVVSSLTVTNGEVSFARPRSQIHIGKRFITDIETLDMLIPEVNTQGRSKNIPAVTIKFVKSRGLLVGPDADNLTEMKQREFENLDEPTRLLTGDKTISIQSDWNTKGRVFMRQKDPLPLTVLAVTPEIDAGLDNV